MINGNQYDNLEIFFCYLRSNENDNKLMKLQNPSATDLAPKSPISYVSNFILTIKRLLKI
jgi:hypothetical protein